MAKIPGRYTLFTHIPVHFDGDRVLTDPLWAKDLVGHFPYLETFQLCCPIEPLAEADGPQAEVPGLTPAQVMPLRADGGYLSILANILPNIVNITRAVRRSDIVHTGGGGWAIPYAYYIYPLSFIFRFDLVMVIESSFWMKPATGRATFGEWLRHHVNRIFLGACLRRARARIFTTDGYRKFFGIPEENTLIAPAVWYEAEDIISADAQAEHLARLPGDEVRLVFPARLVPDKGSDVIRAAVEALETRLPADAPALTVDIIGAGPEAAACKAFAAAHEGRVRVHALDPVEYGAPFFEFLQGYHAILLANRQHEQPRIIFDGFAQGLPVISTGTEGVREIVREGKDALLFDIDDAEGLARCIIRFATDATLRADMAAHALQAAHGHSHQAMHRNRHAFFERTLTAKPKA